MPEYKLVYFNARGKAEYLRWMFKVAGVDFEDYRLKDGEWPRLKETMPFGQIPVLHIDGHQYCQSFSIAKYLAQQFGLGGGTALEDLMIDQVAYGCDDLMRKIEPFTRPKSDMDEKTKAEKTKKFEEEQLPALLSCWEKLLVSNNGGEGWFVGDKMTWADMAFASYVSWVDIMKVTIPWDEYPKLGALKQRVEEYPAIAEWIRTRPQTPM